MTTLAGALQSLGHSLSVLTTRFNNLQLTADLQRQGLYLTETMIKLASAPTTLPDAEERALSDQALQLSAAASACVTIASARIVMPNIQLWLNGLNARIDALMP